MVRCPVCESATVTVVLNSKSHASCACCGSTWIQEGSWQRSVRSAPPALPEDVIRLPKPSLQAPPAIVDLNDPAGEAVGS